MKNAPLPGHCLAGSTCRPTGNKDAPEVKQITSILSSTKSGLLQKEEGNSWEGAQDGDGVNLGVAEGPERCRQWGSSTRFGGGSAGPCW